MSIGAKDKVAQSAKSKQCPLCENYSRQIEEVELTLSGRDAVITALYSQLKKFETNYKKLFTDFEQLRFQHSSAIQDNFNLKEINSKLEEITITEVSKQQLTYSNECHCSSLNNDVASNQKRQPKTSENAVFPILTEINNIGKLVKTQNQILSDLIDKVVKEVKLCTSEKLIAIQDINKVDDPFKQIESGDHLNTHPKFQLLAAEIETLRNLVEQHQKENRRIQQYFLEKRSRLTSCTNISLHIPSLRTNQLPLQKDQEISAADMTDKNKTVKDLELEMQQKERQFEICCCQLIEQLNDMHDNNQMLSDTLSVVTEENKNNLDIVNNLKNELNRVNNDYDSKIDELKAIIGALETALEESKLSEKKLRQSATSTEQEAKNLKDRLKNAIDENSKLKACKCEADKELRTKLIELETTNDDLSHDLLEKAAQIKECEDEKKSLCQKLDILSKHESDLVNNVRDLENKLKESKEVIKPDVNQQTSVTGLIEDPPIKEQECVNAKCRLELIEMMEKVEQMDTLKYSNKQQEEEIDRLNKENNQLKQDIGTLNSRNKLETERLQGLVNHSQNQVEILLREHDEKTAQIQSVANELDNIRKSVNQDNDRLMAQIMQLQQERDSLKRQNQQIIDCQCDAARSEIEKLKAELTKKQCIIFELEKSVDNFNETLRNFDKTAEELSCENACLKTDRARLIRDLELIRQEVAQKNDEIVKIKNETDVNKITCSERSKILEKENETLKNNLEKLNIEKRNLEKELVSNCHMQMEFEGMKQDYTRKVTSISKKFNDLQTAYNELKSLFDKTYLENEKLRADFKNRGNCKDELQQALKKSEFLQAENDRLAKQAESAKLEFNKLGKECAMKCLETLTLKETVEDHKQQKRTCEENCQELKQKQKANEIELLKLRDQLEKMSQKYEEKSQELKKVKKQWECCAKQSQISRDEYNNLRREYKDIKSMLTDQIKKYKVDARGMEAGQQCKTSREIKDQLTKKENEIAALQQKLQNASCEIIELKDYVQKLICDNNVLKSAINNLISNLESKIKGPSFGSLPSNSAEVIAGEILNSLSTIENIIVKNGEPCPKGCKEKYCDCMLAITHQYAYKDTPNGSKSDLPEVSKRRISEGSRTSKNLDQSDAFDCVKKCKAIRERLLKNGSEHVLSKTSSDRSGLASETNTIDSDDSHPTKFFNNE